MSIVVSRAAVIRGNVRDRDRIGECRILVPRDNRLTEGVVRLRDLQHRRQKLPAFQRLKKRPAGPLLLRTDPTEALPQFAEQRHGSPSTEMAQCRSCRQNKRYERPNCPNSHLRTMVIAALA